MVNDRNFVCSVTNLGYSSFQRELGPKRMLLEGVTEPRLQKKKTQEKRGPNAVGKKATKVTLPSRSSEKKSLLPR